MTWHRGATGPPVLATGFQCSVYVSSNRIPLRVLLVFGSNLHFACQLGTVQKRSAHSSRYYLVLFLHLRTLHVNPRTIGWLERYPRRIHLRTSFT